MNALCARRPRTIKKIGRAPMLVYVRPSNEALLRARVPGAQDQQGCPSIPLSCEFREQEDDQVTLPLLADFFGILLGGGEMGRVGQREQRDRHRQRQRSQSLLSLNYPALTAFFRALNNCSWLIGFGRNSTPAALNMLEAFSSFGDPLSTMIGQVGYWER